MGTPGTDLKLWVPRPRGCFTQDPWGTLSVSCRGKTEIQDRTGGKPKAETVCCFLCDLESPGGCPCRLLPPETTSPDQPHSLAGGFHLAPAAPCSCDLGKVP